MLDKKKMQTLVVDPRQLISFQQPFLYQFSLHRLHQVCEASYMILSSLNLQKGKSVKKRLPICGEILFLVEESMPYTSRMSLVIKLSVSKHLTYCFKAIVRLYHDALSAEVVELQTDYNVIKSDKLLKKPVEKFQINCLLYEWLVFAKLVP